MSFSFLFFYFWSSNASRLPTFWPKINLNSTMCQEIGVSWRFIFNLLQPVTSEHNFILHNWAYVKLLRAQICSEQLRLTTYDQLSGKNPIQHKQPAWGRPDSQQQICLCVSSQGEKVRASFLNYLCAAGRTVVHFHGAAEGDTGPLCVNGREGLAVLPCPLLWADSWWGSARIGAVNECKHHCPQRRAAGRGHAPAKGGVPLKYFLFIGQSYSMHSPVTLSAMGFNTT